MASTWQKKQISKSEIEELEKKYSLSPLVSSIMIRRNITEGKDIMYYMEDDLRFQHNPFLFSSMEDAVDRILGAKEEKEKVLIFGDRDVDGVSATTILFDCLQKMGLSVTYRLPCGDDQYGLSMQAVDDFSEEGGTLIITVDCGISNSLEIAHAVEKGIDVIVMDHHNPPEELPDAIIIDAKVSDSGYPFKDISGAAVVYKVVSALRFSQTEWYKEDISLLNVRPATDSYCIEVVKTRNLVPVAKIEEFVVPGTLSISDTRLPEFLEGQQIFVWDLDLVKKMLEKAFGKGVEFGLFDIRQKIAELIPQMAKLSLLRIKDLSKFAKYGKNGSTELGGFFNLFVTYIQMTVRKSVKNYTKDEEKDLQLVALAALADIMPMKNENRIFVKKGISIINKGNIRPGLVELMSRVKLLGKSVTSTDLSWVLVSNLNAAGRMGKADLAARLFLSNDAKEREKVADTIAELNNERKKLTQDAWDFAQIQAQASIPNHNNKLCLVIDDRINRGVSGILAGRLVAAYGVPAMAVTFVGDIGIGSMRSCRNYDATSFLNSMKDVFINHGGHSAAAGFSFEKSRLQEFEERVKELSAAIVLDDEQSGTFNVDAEIPPSYLSPELMKVTELFEPFGEENSPLTFMTKGLKVADAQVLGKGEKQHLKVILQSTSSKWPGLFWNQGEMLNRDFKIGDKVDILYKMERNVFNGMETLQLNISDLKKSSI